MRKIICGSNSIKWGELIQRGQTFILDCHGMSEEKMVFVGSLITHQIKSFFRHEKPRKYEPLRVYIDEAHNFLNQNILGILKEARKFRFSFVMATVDFSDINPKLVHALSNVGTLIAFKCGYREAQTLSREMGVAAENIQALPKHHFAYLTSAKGVRQQTITGEPAADEPKIAMGYAKAFFPPYIRKIAPPRGDSYGGKVDPPGKPKWKGWFPLEPLQPA